MSTNDGLRALIDENIEKALEASGVECKTFGNYRIGREIGRGMMGTVYEAEDINLGRQVVVKVIKDIDAGGADYRKQMIARFRREAQAACRVVHQNVAVTFAFEEFDGRHLLVMEKIEGRTLKEEIGLSFSDKGRPMPMRKSVDVVIGILKGLEAIHAANIVHRDLKPGNVMLTSKDDQVKILDFGLGKPAEASGNPTLDMTLTQHDIPVGTPLYMSPEQIRSLPVDARTDIYSVGVILFQLLTGRPPFLGKSQIETFDLHRNAPVPPITARGAGSVPQDLQTIVRKAMAKDPEARYGSAAEMRAALMAAELDPKPIAAVKQAPKSRPWLLALAVPAVFILAAGAVLSTRAPEPVRGAEAPVRSVKADDVRKASGGIEIPPPPPVAATVEQGCTLYETGRTSDAVATLTRALAAKPNDAEGLYCLCGAYVRQPESADEARKACAAYRQLPDRDAGKTRQVDLWLKRLKR